MYLYFLILILVLSIIAAVLMLSVIVGLVVARGVPFVSSNRRDYQKILAAADLREGETIYDLGCGKSELLIKAAKDFGARGVGYEISLWPFLWSKFNIWRSQAKVKIFFKNFFKADLSEADVVFCYLFPEAMEKLKGKFKNELKAGSRVVSYGFAIAGLEPEKEIVTNNDNIDLGKIFVYTF